MIEIRFYYLMQYWMTEKKNKDKEIAFMKKFNKRFNKRKKKRN